jgi:hypothetical protein
VSCRVVSCRGRFRIPPYLFGMLAAMFWARFRSRTIALLNRKSPRIGEWLRCVRTDVLHGEGF